MRNNEVLATNLKQYRKLNDNTYKILVSFFYTGNPAEKENLTEADFAPVIASMFDNSLTVISNTLVDYKELGSDYKTCLVQANPKVLPVSVASLQNTVEAQGFKTLAKNVFMDNSTNSIWQKVVTESGAVQLVQSMVENLEDLIKQRLNINITTASTKELYTLKADKFDYAFYYNIDKKAVEAGVILNYDENNITIASKQHGKAVTANPHCLIAVAEAPMLVEQFEKELKNSKNAVDVMQAYINAWFKSSEGKGISSYIEQQLKKRVLKATSSVQEDSLVEDVLTDVAATVQAADEAEMEAKGKFTKEEIETLISTKFDAERLTNFVYVEETGENKFIIKLTKQTLGVDDLVYLINKSCEVFEICPTVETTGEFVHLVLAF